MAKILLVDDAPDSVKYLVDRLRLEDGYDVRIATSGEEALAIIEREPPDLVLLDVVMPGMSGFDVCREIRRRESSRVLPVILVTALEPNEQRVQGLEAGADDFLGTPVHWPELIARVRSLLRIKGLLDTVQGQSRDLEQLNRTLEERVAAQVEHIEKLGRLRRFLSPQVAELVVEGSDEWLESHRREIAAIACDLRGFTAFSMEGDPEDAIRLLRDYHEAVGSVVAEFEGTIDHLAGDGVMIFLNDPVACDLPALRAVELAVSMRERVGALLSRWNLRGFEIGFGVGVDEGFATIGRVGFESRFDYAATGRPVILASRLCDVATNGQVLVSQRVFAAVGEREATEFLGEREYKGFHRPVATYNVVSLG